MADTDAERDAFLGTAIPALIGACERRDDTAWCTWHLTTWPPREPWCERASDLDDLGDRLIEMWQGRG